MSKKKKSDNQWWIWIIIVLFVIVLIIIYLSSLGKVNISNNISAPKEFKDTSEQARNRHERLKSLIKKKEAVKEQLEKRFKRIYLSVRLGFVGLWAFYIHLLVRFQLVLNLGDALNYSEAAILIFIALNFLTFGTLSNLNSFIDLIKIRLENWNLGKYVNIDERIDLDKEELKSLSTQNIN